MMEWAYMRDMLLKELETIVKDVRDGKHVLLEDTIFYPVSGGVDHDTGSIISEDGESYQVVRVMKDADQILHDVDREGLQPGMRVKLVLDWERRWKLMRMHTTAHLIAAALYPHGVKITGNMMTVEKGRMDFNLPSFDRQMLEDAIRQVNEWIQQDGEVTTYTLPREEALKQEHLVKLASRLPPSIDKLRIVRIILSDGTLIDEQADGGCHVPRLKDIGRVILKKVENKGKGNRRLVFTLEPE